jgi:hypothetical protein
MYRKIATASFIVVITVVLSAINVSAGPVPDTGQTKCYDETQEIPCPQPGEPFYGQDANYTTNPHSYTKLDANGNDLPDSATSWAMVRDKVTGLIWENKTDDCSIHDRDIAYIWLAVQEFFITELNESNFGGHHDWRLPTIKELSTLVDFSRPYPGPNTTYFSNMQTDFYWSSTTAAGDSVRAWIVVFYGGDIILDYIYVYSHYVQAVCGGQSASFDNSFIDNGNGTVTDTNSGLMWQQATPPGTFTWQQALNYSENLTLGGYSDWRLPDRNELQSLVDYARYNPAIDIMFFPGTQASPYWSSTTHAEYLDHAWVIYFDPQGIFNRNDKSGYGCVRAVRSISTTTTTIPSITTTITTTPTTTTPTMTTTCITSTIFEGDCVIDIVSSPPEGGTTDPRSIFFQGCTPQQVVVTAIPNSGYLFSHWEGYAESTENPMTFSYTGGGGYLTAVFEKSPTSTSTSIITTTTTTPDTSTTTTTISSDPCAAESIYGEQSEQTELLRKYRDEVLSKTSQGQKIIKTYYAFSPAITKMLEQRPLLKEKTKVFIDSLLPGIRKKVEESSKVKRGR